MTDSGSISPMMLKVLSTIVHAFFRVFFTLEYKGTENVPERGAVVIAGNHPSYLDPILIGLVLPRRVYFMAWDRLFSIPVLGAVIRHFGAFPVRLGSRDPNAFAAALAILESDKALGIFPEAGRSKAGIMNPLKTGAVRLAIAARAPIVPVTITGAYDAWPSSRLIPLPRKITVKYHRPIVLDETETTARGEDKAFQEEVTERLRQAIERRLKPSLDADERKRRAFAGPASPARIYEFGPLVAAFGGVAFGGPALRLLAPAVGLLAYVIADIYLIPQGRLAKAVRDLAAPCVALALGPPLARAAGIEVPEWASLAAVGFGFVAAFNWTNYHKAQRFVRGALFGYLAAFGLALAVPHPYGPQIAFASFAAVYAVAWRPLFWPAGALTAVVYGSALAWSTAPLWLHAVPAYVALGLATALYVRVVKFSAHDGRLI
jgi:1-acyl-sn-glycerol-3-phosphate acyltransferase